MRLFYKHLKRDFNVWVVYTLAITIFVAIPLFAVIIYTYSGVGEMWNHIVRYFLKDYILNSIFLLSGAGILTFALGTSTAWVISNYNFPLCKLAEWLLFLPLAIPSYIMAYAYVGLFGNGGSIILLLKSVGINIHRIEMMNIAGLIWVLSFSLFPYVYAAARAVFKSFPKEMRDTSNLLGASKHRFFFSIALPMASPAIIGGLFLVFMEVLNDYGAAKYYGINTFTTGIFRTWTALEDLQSAIFLSAILVLFLLVLTTVVKWYRGRKSYVFRLRFNSGFSNKTVLKGRKMILYSSIIWSTLLFGLFLPLLQLVKWGINTFDSVFEYNVWGISAQSIGLALISSALILIIALALVNFSKWNNFKVIKNISKSATFGYILPGAIIGIGIIRSSQSIVDFAKDNFNLKIGYLFYSSSFVLVYAYIFRFMTIAYNLIDGGAQKIGKQLSESAYLLKISKLKSLFHIEIPLLKHALIGSFLLVFIDIMKELPLTLILKPYNISTLAVKAYEYADDERVAESAIPSLFLIAIISVLIIVVNYRERRKRP